jgi:hypothetical protein
MGLSPSFHAHRPGIARARILKSVLGSAGDIHIRVRHVDGGGKIAAAAIFEGFEPSAGYFSAG